MNHLILRTHAGTNIDLIKNFLKADTNSDFIKFIDENDPDSFIKEYNKDIDNGLVVNKIDNINDIKDIWKDFLYNIVENMEKIYSTNMNNKWFVYITRSYSQKILNTKNIKTIWILRNPLMSWAHKENPVNIKNLCYDIKMLNDEYIQTMISWAEENFTGFSSATMTPYLKNLLSRFDVENTTTFSILFVLMCTNPSSFSLNGNKISQTEFNNCINALYNRLSTTEFINLLNAETTVFPSLSNFEYLNDEDIFNDNNILSKFNSFNDLLMSVYYFIDNTYRNSFIKLVQNFIFIVKKLNKSFEFNNELFLNQHFNKELLKSIDKESLNIIFKALLNLNLDDILYPTDDDDTTKLTNPRDTPLDINLLINKRPNSPENSDDYITAYNLSYMNQIDKVKEILSNVAYINGYNKEEHNLNIIKFSEGYYNGFQSGFNDGSNNVEKQYVWNEKVITYDDGYSLGYESGFIGGTSYKLADTSIGKQSINLYYNGIRDGFYDSSIDINQKLYDYNYTCGYYDKRIEELNSGLGNTITNSVSNYIKTLYTNSPINKLIFYEDIIHQYRVQSWNSIFRFFYFYYFSNYDLIEKIDLNNIKFTDVINQSLALLDMKIFIGQQTLPTNIIFERKNDYLTYLEWYFTYSWPFTPWIQGWEWDVYDLEEWKDLLNKENSFNFNQNNILNTFNYMKKSFPFAYNTYLYSNCKTPYDYYKLIRE